MKTKRRNRKTSKLSPVRWTSYAIAAGATAAGTIATTEAEIHYSGPINYKFHAKSTFIEQTFPLSNGVFLIGAFNNVTFLNYHYAGVGVYKPPFPILCEAGRSTFVIFSPRCQAKAWSRTVPSSETTVTGAMP